MLEYASTRKVSASAARKIQEDIGAIRRTWWRGAIGLEAEGAEAPALLSGSTPLFHGPGIPDEDDLFLAFADAAFIVERLADWSKRFTIKWRLTMNGDDWGAIDASGFSPMLLGQMEKWARRARVAAAGKGSWAVPEERRASLLRKYERRH